MENDSVEELQHQMLEKRPLPIGMDEFEVWSDRIISGALLPGGPDNLDLKSALAVMLLHLPPTTDHECDGYFIKSLRKAAVNQVADAKFKNIVKIRKEALAAIEEKTKGEVTAETSQVVTDGEKT